MATSPIYGWPEPDNSSLVKNGAQDIRALGNAIDTTMATMQPKASNYAAGKNKIINGDFGIWQRGTTFTNPADKAYTSDRWLIEYGAAIPTSNSVTQQTFTPGTAPVAGYEGTYFLRNTITTLGTSNRISIMHRIEDVRTFAGQTVTLSFWAKADSVRTLSGYIQQNFGSGGSATTSTLFSIGSDVSTTWTRYTSTIAIPSISGKTIGSSSYLQLRLDPQASNGCVMDFWGVQLEAGSTATAFQTATGTIQGELAACQRYYWRSTVNSNNNQVYGGGFAASTTAVLAPFSLPVQMRTVPTVIGYANVQVTDETNNFTPSNLVANSRTSVNILQIQPTVSGATQFRPYLVTASGASSFIDASAEL